KKKKEGRYPPPFSCLQIRDSKVLLYSHYYVIIPISVPCASKSNTTCEDCLKNVTCLWCMSTKECVDYPVRSILPKPSVCPLNNARWGLCWGAREEGPQG
uniref:PSI domain-containing protein n=1 Tax=Gadus morhua TaxID=8049 RepID=A0A8C5FA08_GADMO